MALTATIFKADLQIADMDRHYYHDHNLTLARHPSETDERMMVRLLAFIHNAHEDLLFGRGLSTEDEPDLWQRDLTGAIECWIDVGQPDEKRIRRAIGRSRHVIIYSFGGRVTDTWWQTLQGKLTKQQNLSIYRVPIEVSEALAAIAHRSMRLQCSIQDGQIWLTHDEGTIPIELPQLLGPQRQLS